MIHYLYTHFFNLFDKLLWYIDTGPSVHRVFLSPHIGNFRVIAGKIRTVRTYDKARKQVPAYRDFLDKHPHNKPVVGWSHTNLGDIPEIDKTTYIKPYSLVDKLYNRDLPKRGVMFDESSGSSGKPTSWVRGPKERRCIQRVMQVAFGEYLEGDSPIVLNTFSMGAWATGFNTSMSLIGISRVKSIGPDIIKVVDTLNELGPDFNYVILGYPPFLRKLTESSEIDWKKYNINALYGGEGMSEDMRKYLLQYFGSVIGSYGASDLEINIAHETDFTIGLRNALLEDAKLRQLLLVETRGIIPMIFQFNPYDYLFETNDNGELVVTIARAENISPRIRYNIHDLGHSIEFYKLKSLLEKNGYKHLLKNIQLDFSVVFHYGRSDLSVDYNGAVVGPEEVKQIIAEHSRYNALINTFRLISYEDAEARKHLQIAVELVEGATMDKHTSNELLLHLIDKLQILNLDFKSAYSTAQLKPEIAIHQYNTGLFDPAHVKLKNDYVWNIDYTRAKEENIIQN